MTFQTIKTPPLKHNTRQNYNSRSQQITLHSYIRYSGLIPLSTVCSVLFSPDVYGNDTGFEHSTAQFHFSYATHHAVPQLQFPFTVLSTHIPACCTFRTSSVLPVSLGYTLLDLFVPRTGRHSRKGLAYREQ